MQGIRGVEWKKISWGFVAAHLLRLVGSGPVEIRGSLGRADAGLFSRKFRQMREIESIMLVVSYNNKYKLFYLNFP